MKRFSLLGCDFNKESFRVDAGQRAKLLKSLDEYSSNTVAIIYDSKTGEIEIVSRPKVKHETKKVAMAKEEKSKHKQANNKVKSKVNSEPNKQLLTKGEIRGKKIVESIIWGRPTIGYLKESPNNKKSKPKEEVKKVKAKAKAKEKKK